MIVVLLNRVRKRKKKRKRKVPAIANRVRRKRSEGDMAWIRVTSCNNVIVIGRNG